jgi:hypothetical protein
MRLALIEPANNGQSKTIVFEAPAGFVYRQSEHVQASQV